MSNTEWDSAKLGGSMKRNIVNPDLIEERAKCAFDQKELVLFTIGEFRYQKTSEVEKLFNEYPQLSGQAEEYEMTREELMEHQWKKIKLLNEVDPKWITNNS